MSSNALLWPSQGTKPEERLDKHKWLRLPSQGIGGVLPPPEEDLMAYENSFQKLWTQRIPLTINIGQVPSPQTNFTLLINNTFPDLIGADDKELRFTGDDSVPLPYYIQEFDSTTGRLVARFLKPTVADGDLIYIYFGNILVMGTEDPVTVWQGMDFVYPLDSPDSTVENLVGVNSTSTNTTQVDGKIFKATNSADITQFIELTTIDWTNQTNKSDFWIAFWYKTTDTGRGCFIGDFQSGIFPSFNLEITSETGDISSLRSFIRDTNEVLTDTNTSNDAKYIDGEWHLVVFTYDGTNTRRPRLYFDKVLEATGSVRPDDFATIFETTSPFFLFRDPRITLNLAGDMELMRKSNNSILDADAISTMYNNENDDNAFYSGGIAEATPVPPIIDMEYEGTGILMEYET